jgi:hypothetical protein
MLEVSLFLDDSVDIVEITSSRARFRGGVVGDKANCRADIIGSRSAVSTRLRVMLEGVFAANWRKGDSIAIKGIAEES